MWTTELFFFLETAPKRIRKKRREKIGLHGEGTVTPFVDWGCRIRPFSPPHATQTRKHLFSILILKVFFFSSKQQFVLTLRFLHGDAQPSRETIKKSHTKPQIGAPPSPVVTRPPGPPPSYSSTLLYESLISSTAGVFLPLPLPSLEREAAFAIFFLQSGGGGKQLRPQIDEGNQGERVGGEGGKRLYLNIPFAGSSPFATFLYRRHLWKMEQRRSGR